MGNIVNYWCTAKLGQYVHLHRILLLLLVRWRNYGGILHRLTSDCCSCNSPIPSRYESFEKVQSKTVSNLWFLKFLLGFFSAQGLSLSVAFIFVLTLKTRFCLFTATVLLLVLEKDLCILQRCKQPSVIYRGERERFLDLWFVALDLEASFLESFQNIYATQMIFGQFSCQLVLETKGFSWQK